MPECRTSKEIPCHDTAKLGTSRAQRCNSATLSEWTTRGWPVSPPPRSGGCSPDDGAEVKTCTRWPRRASALWRVSAWRSMPPGAVATGHLREKTATLRTVGGGRSG
ncbi:unnamed protein product, partial [Musa textilis]